MGKDYREEPRVLIDFLRGELRGGPILDVPSLEAGQLLESVANLIESLAVQPIPLSERMPAPEDMDGSLVWAGSKAPGLPYWEWCLDDVCTPCSSGYTHWLPVSIKYLPAMVEG